MHPSFHRAVYFALQALRREPVLSVRRELEATQNWSRDRLLDLQWKRVQVLYRHAFETVPWYRGTWSALGLDAGTPITREDWARLPTLEKGTLQDRSHELHSSLAEPSFKSSTSGSSGTPVAVLRSQRAWAHHHANLFRHLRWFGVDVGDPYAYLWGLAFDEEGRRQAALKDLLFNRRRCSAFTLDAPLARRFHEELRRRPVRYLYGYPSAVTGFADEIVAQGLDGRAVGARVAVTTAEVLKDDQRERIAGAFGCPVSSQYGCAEAGIAGLECGHQNLHVPVESVMVETVPDGDGGDEILLTDLHNRVQPVIRYRLGDRVEPAPAECACGRSLPLLGRVSGRAGDTLIFPDGRRVNANLPSYVFKAHGKAGTVREYQFVQYPDGVVQLRVRPGPAWSGALTDQLRREVRDALGLEVDLRLVDRFERRGRGKHRDYVRAEDLGEA